MTPHYYARTSPHVRDRHDKIARLLYHQAFGTRPGLIRRNIHWIASAIITTSTLLFLGASI